MQKVVVIGGGAAGFFGAIACATAFPKADVTVLEAGREPLGKVRISGGGRCNVTHHCFDPAVLVQNYPRGSRALRGAFSRFQPQDTVAWFRQRGVTLKTESDGRMFPVTDDSATIVDCLLTEAKRVGVRLRTGVGVRQVQRLNPGFSVELRSGERLRCDRILLATGSNPAGYRIAEALGHTIAPPVPSLFTFAIADPALRSLAGVSVDPATVTLAAPEAKPLVQTGPLLITHWGLSGPAVLKLSAFGARLLHQHRYRVPIQINWLPQMQPNDLRQTLLAAKQDWAKRLVINHAPIPVPKRLWQYWIGDRLSLPPDRSWANLSKADLNRLLGEIQQGRFDVRGKGQFKEEFVTCGGVQLKEVNFKTMESRCCPGLHFAGEVLDIDGITGGFNFQSAWTTGWLAGQAMGHPLEAAA